MTTESICDAFNHLRSEEEMVPLSKAAVSRSESDWLVGINGTRAMTAFNNRTGGFQPTPVGGALTPTPPVLAEREDRIPHIIARKYHQESGDSAANNSSYRGAA